MASTVRSPSWLRYGIAIVAVIVATIIRVPLDPLWGDKYAFITFFITMVFVGWYSGLRPSLLALLLSTLSARFFFTSPRYSLLGMSFDDFLGLGFYFTLSLVIALVMESQRRAQHCADRSAVEALQKKQALEREVEDRKRAEEEIRRLNENLEVRVVERTAELETANRVLRASEQQQHQLAETLEVERSKLAAAFENMEMGLVLSDGQGGAMSMNAAALRFHGYASAADMHGRVEDYADEWELRALDGRILPYAEWPLPRAIRRDYFRDCEIRLRSLKSGHEWVCSFTAVPVRNSAGDVIFIVLTLLDITQRKQAEERARLIVEASPSGLVLMRRDGRIVMINRQTEEIFGRARSELIGQAVEMLIPPRFREHHHLLRDSFFVNPETRPMGAGRDLFGIRKDGSEFPVEIGLSPLDTTEGLMVLASIVDITERKRAEAKLQQHLARLHLINQIAQSIAERQDLQSIYRVVLAQLEENLSVDFDAICSFDPHTNSLRVAAVGPKSQPLNAQLGLDEQAVFPVDMNGLGACVRGETVYDPDLTEVNAPLPQKLAQAGLRSFAAAPLGIGGKIFGILLTARRAARGYSSGDCEFLKQLSGHVFLAAQHAQLYQNLKTAYDDLRQSQKAVLQQERLRALGQMASGIAHDINNAISPIAIYSESLLENEPNLSPRARDYLTTIQQAIDDVAHTVSRMRDFYRQQEKQITLDPVNLNSLVPQVLDLTRARWRDQTQQRGVTIDVKSELAQSLPPIMGVESEIRDALTNLIFNAVDAMPHGGTLRIVTYSAEREETGGRGNAGRPTHVFLEVADTGTGMDDETRQRCLEPFFTTKGERGTGLGLAMVYGTMQRHSGDIEIKSAVGMGSSIRLLFPLPYEVVDERARSERHAEPMRSLRILIVDDDLLLRKSLHDALHADGHQVVAADGGQAGIDTFRNAHERGEPFEIVITDLGMPHVDGRAVAQGVKETSAATAVILLTGWGQRMKSEGDIPAHVDRVLSKPPKLKELRGALAAVAQERKTPNAKH